MTTSGISATTNPSSVSVATQPVTGTGYSTASTLVSQEPSVCTNVVEKIRAFFSGTLDFIRNLLSKLPLIGHLFDVNYPSEDDKRWFKLQRCVAQAQVSRDPVLDQALTYFRSIESPVTKLTALHYAFSMAYNFVRPTAPYSSDDIAKKFYEAMSDEMKMELRHQIWLQNGSRDDGLGLGYGDHVMATAPRGRLVLRAIYNYLENCRRA